MQRYKVVQQLGDGTYGSVLKAINNNTGETLLKIIFVYAINLTYHQSTINIIKQIRV